MNLLKSIAVLIFLSWIAGCQKEENYPPIEITASVEHISEFGIRDGSIDLEVTGGAPPFSFLWSNNDTTEDLTGIGPGQYSVVISDHRNQMATDTFEITQPEPDSLVVIFHCSHPSATGLDDGAIEVETGGGYPPLTFSWSTGPDSRDLEGIGAGFYILTVSDSRGQVLTDSTELTDLLTDVDGNKYSIQKIGEQTWMGENLRVRHAPDGASIESYAYNNDTVHELKYGRLYTWNAAMSGSVEEEAQGICPCGWHIPSDDEFKKLEMHLGMSQAEANQVNTWRGSPVGTMLKAGGSSGYNAQMAGRMTHSGSFGYAGIWEYMWTSTEYSPTAAWRRCLAKQYSTVGRYNSFTKNYGFSVRCIKND